MLIVDGQLLDALVEVEEVDVLVVDMLLLEMIVGPAHVEC